MRFYFQSLVTLSLLPLIFADYDTGDYDSEVVTKIISETVTTCPTETATSYSIPITVSSYPISGSSGYHSHSRHHSHSHSHSHSRPHSHTYSNGTSSTSASGSHSHSGSGGYPTSSKSGPTTAKTTTSSSGPGTSQTTTLVSSSLSTSTSETDTSVSESSTSSSSYVTSTSSTGTQSEYPTSTTETSSSVETSSGYPTSTSETSTSASSTTETSSSSVETVSNYPTSTSETSTSSSSTSASTSSTVTSSSSTTASSTSVSSSSSSSSTSSVPSSTSTSSTSSTGVSSSSSSSSTSASSSSSSSTHSSSTSASSSTTSKSSTSTSTSTSKSSSTTTSSSRSSTSTSSSKSSTSTTSSKSSTSSTSTSKTSSSSSTTTSHSSSTSSTSTRSSSTASTSATASATPCAYWLEDIKHQGVAPYASTSGYQVFRNVKDFGAKGDGIHDDTAAINSAISSGGRCAPGTCSSTTTTPALVYFPNGTYLVTNPIINYYYTQIIGNPNCLPVIKADKSFSQRWVIDGDQYQPGGSLGWGATNVFWRQIRNFVIDMTDVTPSLLVAGIHWTTSQATSLQNILFKMPTAAGVQHEGLYIEEGSGGFVTDLTFYGGLHGLTVGNQQFTMRNLTFYNSVVAISQTWDWGWTYKGISINNCGTGLDISSIHTANDINYGNQDVASVVFIDSDINNTPIGIKTARTSTSQAPTGGSLILENVRLNNVPVAVQGPQGTVLAGSSGKTTIAAWGQGHAYTPSGPTTFQGTIAGNVRPASLTAGTDYYERSKPQYENIPKEQFLSVRAAGAKGDGVTDDTAVLNAAIQSAASSGKIVFFDAGTYVVTSTIYIPAGSKVVGEAYPVILSSGSYFNSMSATKAVVQIGVAGEVGNVEWSDIIVSTRGAQPGAVLIEWNLASSFSSPSGMWDVHTRVGGFAGSNLQLADCPKTPDTVITEENIVFQCIAAFMSMHITPSASGLYLENVWLWVADHDVEDASLTQITIYAGRGLLIESEAGGIWAVGTAVEHHQLYEYQLSQTKDIFLGQIQTETAYYQPNPDATLPFPALSAWNDPIFTTGQSGWGLRIVESQNILIYGAGLYSFFSNYNVHCSDQGNGETCQTEIFSVENSNTVSVYNLNTVGTGKMVTVDGVDKASYADNLGGFIDTIALFRYAGV